MDRLNKGWVNLIAPEGLEKGTSQTRMTAYWNGWRSSTFDSGIYNKSAMNLM